MIPKKTSFKKAFSMIELIIVIVILGIVSSLGAEIVANVYEQYILQRAQHRASFKTELTTLQIANRLRYAINGTVYRIKSDGTREAIESDLTGSGNVYTGLQWVGYDADSFEALNTTSGREPGWSGFVDLDASSKNILTTLGSKLSLTNNIIDNLSGSSKDITNAVIYFPSSDIAHSIISAPSDEQINLLDVTSRTLAEQYKLAWSSYALICENGTADFCGDLYLYYNFVPTPATTVLGTNKRLLLRNVSNFKFQGTASGIRFKICKEERISEDFNVTACKEKVAF